MSDLVEVRPVNRVDSDTGTYAYEHDFDGVVVEDIDEDNEFIPSSDVEKVELESGETAVRYQYKHKVAVFITEDSCYMKEGDDLNEAREQCYFALSVLDSKGFVRRFRQV